MNAILRLLDQLPRAILTVTADGDGDVWVNLRVHRTVFSGFGGTAEGALAALEDDIVAAADSPVKTYESLAAREVARKLAAVRAAEGDE